MTTILMTTTEITVNNCTITYMRKSHYINDVLCLVFIRQASKNVYTELELMQKFIQ